MSAKECVKKARLALCMNQNEFAKLLGISQTSLTFYETGKKKPHLKNIRRIVEILKANGIKIDYSDFNE